MRTHDRCLLEMFANTLISLLVVLMTLVPSLIPFLSLPPWSLLVLGPFLALALARPLPVLARIGLTAKKDLIGMQFKYLLHIPRPLISLVRSFAIGISKKARLSMLLVKRRMRMGVNTSMSMPSLKKRNAPETLATSISMVTIPTFRLRVLLKHASNTVPKMMKTRSLTSFPVKKKRKQTPVRVRSWMARLIAKPFLNWSGKNSQRITCSIMKNSSTLLQNTILNLKMNMNVLIKKYPSIPSRRWNNGLRIISNRYGIVY